VLLRHYLEQGRSKEALARELGISRRTIYHWIQTGQLDRDLDDEAVHYRPRLPVPTKLDPYKPLIAERLAEFPDLTAVRLFEEARAAGYEGGYTQLKVYVRQVRPRPAADPVVRFETAPGQQAQVDFARFRFPWGQRSALLVVLGYSRLLWLHFYPREDMRTLMRGLEAAFGFFGGVPRELLFDQMRSVITRDLRDQDGPLVRNEEFLRFAAHWGFRPRACRP
jgi:transposase